MGSYIRLKVKDHAGITTSSARRYTASGMVLTQTDGRGNTAITRTDIEGRTISVTDAAGNTTTTAYCACCDAPALITDPPGHTTCYRYDVRGRKVAEWGTAVQPALFGYDDADRMTTLTTFGAVTADGDVQQPIQWSSEYNDTELGLVYYNYRHYNPVEGRWMRRDVLDETSGEKVYVYCNNSPILLSDFKGAESLPPSIKTFVDIYFNTTTELSLKSRRSLTKQLAEKSFAVLSEKIFSAFLDKIIPVSHVINAAGMVITHNMEYGYFVYGFQCKCSTEYKFDILEISGRGMGSSRNIYTPEISPFFHADVQIARAKAYTNAEKICE